MIRHCVVKFTGEARRGGSTARNTKAAGELIQSILRTCGDTMGLNVPYQSLKKCPNNGKCREVLMQPLGSEVTAALVQDLRDRRDSWTSEDQRVHLQAILGIDSEDQISRTPNSGSVLGVRCCDSHLCWAWGNRALFLPFPLSLFCFFGAGG